MVPDDSKPRTAPGASTRFPHLIMIEGHGAGRVFALSREAVTIGRDPRSDIVLPYSTVSWHHATVAVTTTGVVVRDLGSRNGTLVGVEKVVRRVLYAGDVIGIGDRVALKLVYLPRRSVLDAAAQASSARAAMTDVQKAAALLGRLGAELAATRGGDAPVVLLFLRVSTAAATPDAESLRDEVMRSASRLVRQDQPANDPGRDLVAPTAARDTVLLLRSTSEHAEHCARKIAAVVTRRLDNGHPAQLSPRISAAIVPIPATTALTAEAILMLATHKAQEAMDGAAGQIVTVSLEAAQAPS